MRTRWAGTADGTERRLMEGQRIIQNPQFSPDGRWSRWRAGRGADALDIWVHELESGTATRLTFDGGRRPVWMPDNVTVTYSHQGANGGIYARRRTVAAPPTSCSRSMPFTGLSGGHRIDARSPTELWRGRPRRSWRSAMATRTASSDRRTRGMAIVERRTVAGVLPARGRDVRGVRHAVPRG